MKNGTPVTPVLMSKGYSHITTIIDFLLVLVFELWYTGQTDRQAERQDRHCGLQAEIRSSRTVLDVEDNPRTKFCGLGLEQYFR